MVPRPTSAFYSLLAFRTPSLNLSFSSPNGLSGSGADFKELVLSWHFSFKECKPAFQHLHTRNHLFVFLNLFLLRDYDCDSVVVILRPKQFSTYKSMLTVKLYRPARPNICMISRSAYSLMPSSWKQTVFLIMTRWHGRLTPTASVEVQHITCIWPSRKPFSMACLSGNSSPAW